MKVGLKALRVNQSLTQAEVAGKIGVAKETVGNWENHKTSPDGIKLLQLCHVYGCVMDDIFLPDRLAKREEKSVDKWTGVNI